MNNEIGAVIISRENFGREGGSAILSHNISGVGGWWGGSGLSYTSNLTAIWSPYLELKGKTTNKSLVMWGSLILSHITRGEEGI